MKIVQVPARFYPRRGGIEELVLQSSRELVKRGHSVTVVCADEPAVGDLEVEGIRVIRLPVMATISNTPVTPGLLGTLLSLDWDVLHSHVPHPWAPEMCAIAAFKKKKPLFVTYHNDTVGRGPHRMTAFLYNNTALPFVLSRARKIFMTGLDFAAVCSQGIELPGQIADGEIHIAAACRRTQGCALARRANGQHGMAERADAKPGNAQGNANARAKQGSQDHGYADEDRLTWPHEHLRQ